MTTEGKQYVLQIQVSENAVSIGWLALCFEVSESAPIPTIVPPSYIQVVMTNTVSFNAIVEVYKEHTNKAVFSRNGDNIECSGAVTNSWPID